MLSIITFLLAILALSFLIFIHELGHYFMARREGMRVEVFSIGFGKPIVSWLRKGVKWQIGWIPFGGYVKIAGTDTEKEGDLYTVKDGFFGKGPWARIKVAFMGPFVNILFALMVFALVWVNGGRDKSFGEYTHKIGFVDPKSELYQRGLRSGDEIQAYDDHLFEGMKDHLYAPLTSSNLISVKGYRVNYSNLDKTPFDYRVKVYPHPLFAGNSIVTAGILNPASYLIYDRLPGGQENPLPEGSPLINSGLQYGDRLIWADGHLIFSVPQLTEILNDNKALLTVVRGDQVLQLRIPRILAAEFLLDPEFKEELVDWQYEANLKGIKLQDLYTLPYNLSNDGVVENPLKFLDKEEEEKAFPDQAESRLLTRDKIIAVNGQPVKFSYQILSALQKREVNLIVERNPALKQVHIWTEADPEFDADLDYKSLEKIVKSLGSDKPVKESGKYVLLKPISPKLRSEFIQTLAKTSDTENKEEDKDNKAQKVKAKKSSDDVYVIGMPMIQDRKVQYNPIPTDQFGSVFSEIWRTLKALVTGTLNPKFLSGPVGIVQVVQSQGMAGVNEMLFWIGAISLNLGILNLLPIPMLDGGTIMLSAFELITRRKIHPKTLEKLILPFAILLILFFVYVTFNDISRIFGGYFKW